MARTRLHFFGGVSLSGSERIVRNFGTVRAAKLLVLLSLSRNGRMPRTQLADQLWPDDFYDSTRLRLRQEIHRLKQVLQGESDLIGADQNDVWIDKSLLDTDLDVLENLAKGRHEDDVDQCFEAEFLPGWDDTWVIGERTRASQLQKNAAVALGSQLLESGDPNDALVLSRKLIARHPLDEEIRMVAVHAHAKLGSVAAAVAEYQELRREMHSQLGVEPADVNLDFITALAEGSTVSRATAPTPIPVDWTSTIPVPPDPIIGREVLTEEILGKLRLPSTRLLTLVGPGGVGKTRLAVDVAHKLLEIDSIRVGFASLADTRDPSEWARSVLSHLRDDPPAEVIPIKFLSGLLKVQSTILILDNFETVLPEAAEGIRSLIAETPGLKVIITSVAPCRLPNEVLVPVGTLDPSTAGREVLESALQSLRPAALSQPGVTEDLLEISRRLDGYPLALRLASARLRLLSPKAVLEQLGVSMGATGRSDLPERHRSLEAALASSVEALDASQRATLDRIAAYPGGLSMDIAAIEFNGEPYIENIEALLDSALITLEDQTDPVRIRLLAPIRQYVQSKLTEEQRHQLEERAVNSIWEFLESYRVAPWYPVTPRVLHALDPEADNLAFAWKWSLDRRPELAFRAAAGFGRYEMTRGRGAHLLEEVLVLKLREIEVPVEIMVQFELALGYLYINCHRESQAKETIDHAKELAISLNSIELQAWSALALALYIFRIDILKAKDYATEALSLAEKIGDRYAVARIHKLMGRIADYFTQPEQIVFHLRQSHAGMLATDAIAEAAPIGIHLGFHLWYQGLHEESTAIMQKSRTTVELTRDPASWAYLNEIEGRLAIEQNQPVEAEAYFREALRLWSAMGSNFQEADQNHSITRAIMDQGRWADAKESLIAAGELWHKDEDKGGLCASLVFVASVLFHEGRVDLAKKALAFAEDFEKEHNLIIVQGELDYRNGLIAKMGPSSSHDLPLTLDAGLSLFDSLR